MSTGGGGLVVVATPIGNLGDLSPRAVETLRDATKINITITLLSGEVMTATVASDEEIARLVAELVAKGEGVIDVRRRTADLESIFRGNA